MTYTPLTYFIDNANDKDLLEFIRLLIDLEYMDQEDHNNIPQSWDFIYKNYNCEEILYALTLLPNDKIRKLEIDNYVKCMPLSNFVVNELEMNGLYYNRESILMNAFPIDNEYLVYLSFKNNQIELEDECYPFLEKYGMKEKFNNELDIQLALLNYEIDNVREFVIKLYGELDYYEIKHYKIRTFFKVWDIYKGLDYKDKERFYKNVMMPYFMHINWRTVSRLYDIHDIEFQELFSDYIDEEFALLYNQGYKK